MGSVMFETSVWICAEFTREVTDTQMPLVAPVILPEMYKIFTMAEVLQPLLPVPLLFTLFPSFAILVVQI